MDAELDAIEKEFEAMKDPNSPNYSSPSNPTPSVATNLYTDEERSQFDDWLG